MSRQDKQATTGVTCVMLGPLRCNAAETDWHKHHAQEMSMRVAFVSMHFCCIARESAEHHASSEVADYL